MSSSGPPGPLVILSSKQITEVLISCRNGQTDLPLCCSHVTKSDFHMMRPNIFYFSENVICYIYPNALQTNFIIYHGSKHYEP